MCTRMCTVYVNVDAPTDTVLALGHEELTGSGRKLDRIQSSTACWPWTAATGTDPAGSGSNTATSIAPTGVVDDAPRADPRGHGRLSSRCDNPPCVNPAHLFVGTRAENIADMDAKGRRRSHPHFGESNPLARLTIDQVREIRRRGAEGENGLSLASAFGVSGNTISRVLSHKTWTAA